MLWLASRERLRTMDRLHSGTHSNRTYVLCNQHDEDHSHLFFSCTFLDFVWREIASRAQISLGSCSWTQLWEDAVHFFHNSSKHKEVGLALATAVYHIWRERNYQIFQQRFTSAERSKDDAINSIKERLFNLDDDSQDLANLLNRWG